MGSKGGKGKDSVATERGRRRREGGGAGPRPTALVTGGEGGAPLHVDVPPPMTQEALKQTGGQVEGGVQRDHARRSRPSSRRGTSIVRPAAAGNRPRRDRASDDTVRARVATVDEEAARATSTHSWWSNAAHPYGVYNAQGQPRRGRRSPTADERARQRLRQCAWRADALPPLRPPGLPGPGRRGRRRGRRRRVAAPLRASSQPVETLAPGR